MSMKSQGSVCFQRNWNRKQFSAQKAWSYLVERSPSFLEAVFNFFFSFLTQVLLAGYEKDVLFLKNEDLKVITWNFLLWHI